ncbi:MAG: hypothetical protein H6740_08335 [Alphaproteobacteria bacterium]|nr:hypothetical protein [Alphaproteobacteria bacterium]
MLSLLLTALTLLLPSTALAQGAQAECLLGCSAGADYSADAWMLTQEEGPITVRFRLAFDPAEQKRTIKLYAGNPRQKAALTAYGPLEFSQDGTRYFASWQFSAQELGTESFILVLVSENRFGRDPELLLWRPVRIVTPGELAQQTSPPDPSTRWELDLRPWVLRAQTPAGALPRSTGEETTWWSLAGQESWTDLDLDGETSGLPGVGVQVSQPWPADAGSGDWKRDILDRAQGVEGHTVQFEDMQWTQQPDRVVEVSPSREGLTVRLVSYYASVSLWTNAQSREITAEEAGALGNKTYFAHETSAKLRNPDDPRFWSGYSRRDLSADPELLELLAKQLSDGRAVPGLPDIARGSGDLGDSEFQVGFYAQLNRWIPPADLSEVTVTPGIVAVDVVAARKGIGAPVTSGSAGQSDAQRQLAELMGGDGEARTLDLDAPPEGYFISPALAALGTRVGNVPLFQGKPRTAQRNPLAGLAAQFAIEQATAQAVDQAVETAASQEPALIFPGAARFVLSSTFRAGALMQEGPFMSQGKPKSMTPINGYTQYILKLTVAMEYEDRLVTSSEVLIPTKDSFSAETNIAEKPPNLMERVSGALGIPAWVIGLVVLGVLLIALLYSPLGQSMGGVVGVFTTLAEKVGGAAGKVSEAADKASGAVGGAADKVGGVADRAGAAASGAADKVGGVADRAGAGGGALSHADSLASGGGVHISAPASGAAMRVVIQVESEGKVVARTVVEVPGAPSTTPDGQG